MVVAIQRVMPTSFFLLLRFFLRVDRVLIRINDTRLYHEAGGFLPFVNILIGNLLLKLTARYSFSALQAGNDYMLREFSTRESKIEELQVGYRVHDSVSVT